MRLGGDQLETHYGGKGPTAGGRCCATCPA
jgi:hypothetical protein